MPIYIFQMGDAYHAVSNEAHGVGHLVDTLAPHGLVLEQAAKTRNGVITARSPGRERPSAGLTADCDSRSS
jgi:hypothetical protein